MPIGIKGFPKGNIPYNKNKTKIDFPQMSNAGAKKGVPSWNKGLNYKLKPLSREWKDRIGKANKGRLPWTTGKHHTEETRRRISIAHKGMVFSKEHLNNLKKSHLGKKQSTETIAKRLASMRKFFLSKQPTSIEKKVYDYLLLKGILFEKQKLVNGRFIVDAYIPSLNLVIEADGTYWHGRKDNQEKDRVRDEFINKNGFNLIRLSETEINNGEFIKKLNII